MPAFDAAGVKLYALSYDEPDSLRDFQNAYDITFTLLSDPDSSSIREYGILNTLIAEDDHPWFGIPFPGTYVTDARGQITHKFFENNLALRVGPEQLLRAIMGPVDVRGEEDKAATTAIDRTTLKPEVFVEGEHLAVGVMRDLVARFEVPATRHLYAMPASAGMLAVNLELDPHPKVVTKDLVRPESHMHYVEATGERFQVHSGDVELRIPLTVNGTLVDAHSQNKITLSGSIRWQICDDEVCDVPQHQRFEVTLPLQGAVISELMARPGHTNVKNMNALKHFKKMSSRRVKNTK